jgi:hypothetical protein
MAAGRKPWWEAPKAAEIQACARRISDGAPIDVAIMATWTCSDRAARRGRALGYDVLLRLEEAGEKGEDIELTPREQSAGLVYVAIHQAWMEVECQLLKEIRFADEVQSRDIPAEGGRPGKRITVRRQWQARRWLLECTRPQRYRTATPSMETDDETLAPVGPSDTERLAELVAYAAKHGLRLVPAADAPADAYDPGTATGR